MFFFFRVLYYCMRPPDYCYGVLVCVVLAAVVILFFRNKKDEDETTASPVCHIVEEAKSASSDEEKVDALRHAVQFWGHQTRWRLNMAASLFAGLIVSAGAVGASSSQRLGLFFIVFCVMSLCQYYIDAWHWSHVDQPAMFMVFNVARTALTGKEPLVELWFGDATEECAAAIEWEARDPDI